MFNDPVGSLVQKYGKEDVVLTAREAAEMCRRSIVTMETWRRKGIGPAFIRVGGRVLYPMRDLRSFLGLDRAA